MEGSGVLGGRRPLASNPFLQLATLLPSLTAHPISFFLPSSLSLKVRNHFPSHNGPKAASSSFGREATASDTFSGALELAAVRNVSTDYMYVMKCVKGENFSKVVLQRSGNIVLSPSVEVLNYGQGLFEILKAYRKEDGTILPFCPEENVLRMRMGAERMCMPSPTVKQFVEAVKATVLANKRWVPPPHKGSLYIRPLLVGSGAVLGLAPATEYTFLIYVSSVGNYFKATPGGTAGVNMIGNYAAVLKAQSAAKAKGFSDVLYLDCVHKKYLEEVSSCNIFIVKDNIISTPTIKGTILLGITRKSIIDVARSQGFQVKEQPVAVDELLDAEDVFCAGTAVVVSPVSSTTYMNKRVSYGEDGVGAVSKQLYTVLTRLQMGLIEDEMNWTLKLS